MKQNNKNVSYTFAFTIVELLVVIVVIGVLAAIISISYSGISQRAIKTAISSDLSNNSTLLKLYKAENESFPTSLDGNNCPSAPKVDTRYCLKTGSSTTLNYAVNGQGFILKASSSGFTYQINEVGTISASLSCPVNFIVVPGSATYGTSDFCVMKYEAKNNGSNVAVSKPDGLPWTSVSRNDAFNYAKTVAGCDTCHLITEAEWMTIAQNVANVKGNWKDNVVGTGSNALNYIYFGHSDNSPSSLQAASSNDSLGYTGTGNFAGDTSGAYGIYGDTQRRTLTLSNGEVIWDIAGNAWEWTSGLVTGSQPGVTGNTGFTESQWNTVNANTGLLSPSPLPSSTGIATASSWTTWNGIGSLYSYHNNTDTRAFLRGGAFNSSQSAGVFSLFLTYTANDLFTSFGFRVTSNL